jgi:hypothetical protein
MLHKVESVYFLIVTLYNVLAILYLKHSMLFHKFSRFCAVAVVLSEACVQYQIWLFLILLILTFFYLSAFTFYLPTALLNEIRSNSEVCHQQMLNAISYTCCIWSWRAKTAFRKVVLNAGPYVSFPIFTCNRHGTTYVKFKVYWFVCLTLWCRNFLLNLSTFCI